MGHPEWWDSEGGATALMRSIHEFEGIVPGERLRIEALRRPAVYDCFSQLGEGDFAFVVAVPALIGVVEGKSGNDDGTGLCRDECDIVAHLVERAGFVGDG